jgi:hypothetical protein
MKLWGHVTRGTVSECRTVLWPSAVPHLCCGRVPRNNHSTIQDFGSVSGGRVNHNTIQRSVREGQVGYVSRGVLIDKRSNYDRVKRRHAPTYIYSDELKSAQNSIYPSRRESSRNLR